jgi:hypothetical protein
VTPKDWSAVSAALSARPGWHLETDGLHNIDLWCFGLEGACRLVVSMPDGGILLYDADDRIDATSEHFFESVDDLIAWLELHEAEHEGFTELQETLIDHLLPDQIEEWGKEGGGS